jgi:hypothetical protein
MNGHFLRGTDDTFGGMCSGMKAAMKIGQGELNGAYAQG